MSEETTTTTEETTTEETAPEMVPASRLRGIIKEKVKLEEDLASMRDRLDSIETEKLTDSEKLQRQVDHATQRATDLEGKLAAQTRRLQMGAVASVLSDAHNPNAAAKLVPPEILEFEGESLTTDSKSQVDAWLATPDNAWMLKPKTRPGHTPGPGTPETRSAKKRYEEAVEKGDFEAAKKAMADMGNVGA